MSHWHYCMDCKEGVECDEEECKPPEGTKQMTFKTCKPCSEKKDKQTLSGQLAEIYGAWGNWP